MGKYYLPGGLIVMVALAYLWPAPGVLAKEHYVVQGAIVVIFLVSGIKLNVSSLKPTPQLIKLIGTATVLNLLIAPILARVIVRLFSLDDGLAFGLIITALVPTTLSSCIVITENAKGDGTLALGLTVILNLLGIVTIPSLAPHLLPDLAGVTISSTVLFYKLLLFVLCPLVVGYGAKRLLSIPAPSWLNHLSSSCILLTVMASMASNRAMFDTLGLFDLGFMLVLAWCFHWLLLRLVYSVSRLLKYERKTQISMIFVCSQKTLPVALTIYVGLPPAFSDSGILGTAMLFTLCFHFLQILTDSSIAAKWSKDESRHV